MLTESVSNQNFTEFCRSSIGRRSSIETNISITKATYLPVAFAHAPHDPDANGNDVSHKTDDAPHRRGIAVDSHGQRDVVHHNHIQVLPSCHLNDAAVGGGLICREVENQTCGLNHLKMSEVYGSVYSQSAHSVRYLI